MTPQFILRCAVSSGKPYCNDYSEQPIQDALNEIENMNYAPGYSEPGYTDPKRGILFANWNKFPSRATDLLERYGYECEWSDEWSTCEDCGKAVRTSPDSYGWKRSYYLANECEVICSDCALDDPDEYLTAHVNNPRTAITFDIDPCDHGFTLIARDYENGFHPGQNDDPKTIYKAIKPKWNEVLFKIDDVGQFDMRFSVYGRNVNRDEVNE